MSRLLVRKVLRRIRTSENSDPRMLPVNDAELSLREIAELASQRHGGARGRALDRIAKQQGLDLSYTTVDRILVGKYRSIPKPATLDALAVLAGVPKERVYKAAGVPMPMAPFAEQLPPDADLLTPLQRDAVLAVVRQFAQANRALHASGIQGGAEDEQRPAAIAAPDESPGTKEVMLRAARKTGRKTEAQRAEELGRQIAAEGSGGTDRGADHVEDGA